jgi:hypothetical protein
MTIAEKTKTEFKTENFLVDYGNNNLKQIKVKVINNNSYFIDFNKEDKTIKEAYNAEGHIIDEIIISDNKIFFFS